MQKLFPKNGSKFPQLRFAGFADAWEQRKLGEVADIIGGGTPSTNVSEYWNGDIDWYSPVVKKRSLGLVYKKVQLIYYQWEQCSLHHVQVLETLLFLQKKGVLIKAFNQLFHTKTCLIAILYFLELLN